MKTDSFLSISQFKAMIEDTFLRYPKEKQAFSEKLIEFPKSKDNIPKQALLIKLKPGTNI
jgi:hypothetical protein